MGQRLLTLTGLFLKTFIHARSGQMGVLAALAAFPLAVSSGVTLDYTREGLVESQLLEATRQIMENDILSSEQSPAHWSRNLQRHLQDQVLRHSEVRLTGLSLVRQGDEVRVLIQGELPTRALNLVGINHLPLEVSAVMTVPDPDDPKLVAGRGTPPKS